MTFLIRQYRQLALRHEVYTKRTPTSRQTSYYSMTHIIVGRCEPRFILGTVYF